MGAWSSKQNTRSRASVKTTALLKGTFASPLRSSLRPAGLPLGSVEWGAWRVLRSRTERASREWSGRCGGEGTEGQRAWRLRVEGQGVDYLSCCHDQMPDKEQFKGIVP